MTTQAVFNANTDSDWFAAQLLAGVTYQVTLSPQQETGNVHLIASSVEDSELTIDNYSYRSEIGGFNKSLVFTPLVNSLFYIEAGHSDYGFESSSNSTSTTEEDLDLLASLDPSAIQKMLDQLGLDSLDDLKAFLGGASQSGSVWPLNYSLSIDSITDDYADNEATTGSVTAGSAVQGNIDAIGDADWFKANLSAGVTYEFSLESPDLTSLTLSAFDLGRTREEMADFTLSGSSLVLTPSEDSIFIIEVDGKLSSGTGAYTLSLESIEDDYADTHFTTGSIIAGSSVNGIINAPDDADVFKTVLAANTTYQVVVTVDDSTLPIFLGMDSSNDSNGLYLGDSDLFDFGANKVITFSTLDGGDYFIRLEEIGAGSLDLAGEGHFSPVNYNIAVSSVTDDYFDTVNTMGSISVNNIVTGTLEVENDNDWFKASLDAGITYQAKVVAVNSGGTLNLQAYGSNNSHPLIDSVGRFEVATADSGTQLVFTPRESGDFYFDISSFSEFTGDYSLELTAISDDYADTTATTGILGVGGSLVGRIDAAGDKDWIAVDLTSNITYQLTLSSAGSQGLGMTVYSKEDNEYSIIEEQYEYRTEFSSFPEVVFTPNDNARYYIEVGGPSPTVTDYTVSVTTIDDDYPDHDGTAAVLVVNDSGGNGDLEDTLLKNLTQTEVSGLYVAIFNRASEGGGNEFWQETGLSVAEMATEMLATGDAQVYFGDSLSSDEAFIEHIYLNTLNKTPADDADGISFWVSALGEGNSRGFIVSELITAAQHPANAGAAQNQFNERVAISNYAADTLSATPSDYGVVLGFNENLNGLTLTGAYTSIDVLL